MVATSLNNDLDREPPALGMRTSIFWTVFTWAHVLTILFVAAGLAIVVGGLGRLCGDRYGRVAHACISFGYRVIVRWHPCYRLTITGTENLPQGAAILCPNHQSLSDVVYLFSLPIAYRWVIKKELFYVPLFGAAMRVAGYPKIDRGNADSAQRLVNKVRELLSAGIPVLSFPEGTRRPNGGLGRFHTGPARMAVVNQVALVPVGVVGTSHLLPRGSVTYPASAHISIHIGQPLDTKGRGIVEVRALTRELRVRVEAAKLAAQRAIDAAPGVR